MKYIPSILSALVISLGIGVFIVHAEGYAPLAPLPGTFTGGSGQETTNLSTYLSGAIKLLIALGAGLAVLFAVIGGTQYVAASINPAAKAGALERIQNSIIGLIIILSAYLLLNSINPKLVQFNLSLTPVSPGVYKEPGLVEGGAWADDSLVRQALTGNPYTVFVKTPSCTTIGQQNCTSVAGLGASAISGLRNLADTCKAACYDSLVVTGGTEYWLHRTHDNGLKVDLRKSSGLDGFIKTAGSSLGQQAACSSLGLAWRYQGAIYVDEGDHWHVCY